MRTPPGYVVVGQFLALAIAAAVVFGFRFLARRSVIAERANAAVE